MLVAKSYIVRDNENINVIIGPKKNSIKFACVGPTYSFSNNFKVFTYSTLHLIVSRHLVAAQIQTNGKTSKLHL